MAGLHTCFSLIQCQLVPIVLHPVPQRHPQISLLLWWHSLPSLLNLRERRVRDSTISSRARLLVSDIGCAYW